MAAEMLGAAVRLRLVFDYPPPGSPDCALCWLLLEPSRVRLVTDLISLIRDRFGYSRRAQLSLFLEGALLPPGESVRLVRDNDSLRVKLEEVVAEDFEEVRNGFSLSSRKERKRHRQKLDEESESEDEQHRKQKNKPSFEHLSCQVENSLDSQDSWKKPKKRKKEVNERTCVLDSKDDGKTGQSKKFKKKLEKEKAQETENKDKNQKKTRTIRTKTGLEKTSKSIPPSPMKKSMVQNTKAQSSKKKVGTSSDSSTTSSDSDHSKTEKKHSKSLHKTKVATPQRNKPQLAADSAAKAVSASKAAAKSKDGNSHETVNKKMVQSQSSSSDSNSSTEVKEQSSNLKITAPSNNPPAVKNIVSNTAKAKSSSSDADSSDSETFVIKKPNPNAGFNKSLVGSGGKPLPTSIQGPTTSPHCFGRGRGRGEDNFFWRGPRGRGGRGMSRSRGRGRGESTNFNNYSSEHQKQQQLNEMATNTSVIIQNQVEVPKRDYSVLPLLAAPPQAGEKIAFKLLELTENYTPEVSDYKEGKIITWNPSNKQLELEVLSSSAVVKEPGKFDLVYESANGAATIEYAVSRDTKITESWDALIEPRLIVELPPNNQPSTEDVKP
uniref:Coilin n=1 Tax=Sphenodon punctatus TaxID=8508 RepID=A0A8D0GLF0_SPHPU